MDQNKERAKELYFKYACNHFFLDRDIDSEEYKSFRVSAEEERDWRKEYIKNWTSKLSVDDLYPLKRLEHAYANEALPSIIRMADRGDSYSKFWFAFSIHSMAKWIFFSPVLRIKAMRKAKSLWKSLVDGTLEITDEHKKAISPQMMTALGALTPEEYIRIYSKRKLKEIG